jgi:hypothetical protein
LIRTSVAAISRNSPARSSSSASPPPIDLQELLRDVADGDVEDVDVLLADQVQQQVEGPWKRSSSTTNAPSANTLGFSGSATAAR